MTSRTPPAPAQALPPAPPILTPQAQASAPAASQGLHPSPEAPVAVVAPTASQVLPPAPPTPAPEAPAAAAAPAPSQTAHADAHDAAVATDPKSPRGERGGGVSPTRRDKSTSGGKFLVSADSLQITDTLLGLTTLPALPRDIAREIEAFASLHTPQLSADTQAQMNRDLADCKRLCANLAACEVALLCTAFTGQQWLATTTGNATTVLFATINTFMLLTEVYALRNMVRVTDGVLSVLAFASVMRLAWPMLAATSSAVAVAEVVFALPSLFVVAKCVHGVWWAQWSVGVTWDDTNRWLYVYAGCKKNEITVVKTYRLDEVSVSSRQTTKAKGDTIPDEYSLRLTASNGDVLYAQYYGQNQVQCVPSETAQSESGDNASVTGTGNDGDRPLTHEFVKANLALETTTGLRRKIQMLDRWGVYAAQFRVLVSRDPESQV